MKSQKRFNLMMPKMLKERIELQATRQGISMAEYIKDAVKEKLLKDEAS